MNLGRLLHEAGDRARREEHYRLALAARPDDATAVFNLGVALEDLARADEALAAYESAVAIDPENADAHYNAASLYERHGPGPGGLAASEDLPQHLEGRAVAIQAIRGSPSVFVSETPSFRSGNREARRTFRTERPARIPKTGSSDRSIA